MHLVVSSPLLEALSAEKTRLTARWPIISMPPPDDPGAIVSVDYVGLLTFIPRGNTYILLFTDRFSRRADMFPVGARGGYSQDPGESIHPLVGVPAHHTSGKRPAGPIQAFTSCISAVECAQACYKFLSSHL